MFRRLLLLTLALTSFPTAFGDFKAVPINPSERAKALAARKTWNEKQFEEAFALLMVQDDFPTRDEKSPSVLRSGAEITAVPVETNSRRRERCRTGLQWRNSRRPIPPLILLYPAVFLGDPHPLC